MTSRSVTVVNQLGMHARAAAKFVHLATKYRAHVRVGRDGREMDGKSIMGILLLAAARGTTITISADGADERDAIEALVALVDRALVKTHAAPERNRRLSWDRVGPGGDSDPARQVLRYQIGKARLATSSSGSRRAASARGSSWSTSARASRSRGPSWRRCSTRSC